MMGAVLSLSGYCLISLKEANDFYYDVNYNKGDRWCGEGL